jgi:hypothetical protein
VLIFFAGAINHLLIHFITGAIDGFIIFLGSINLPTAAENFWHLGLLLFFCLQTFSAL